MAPRLEEMLQRLVSFNADETVIQFMNSPEITSEIIKRNQDQLRAGFDSMGEALKYVDAKGVTRLGYSKATELINPNKREGTHFTLEDEGFFFSTFRVERISEGISIEANPNRGNANLFVKFGDFVIGLNRENRDWLIDVIKEKLNLHVRREILQI